MQQQATMNRVRLREELSESKQGLNNPALGLATVPDPYVLNFDIPDDKMSEYEALSEELGIKNRALDELRLKRFLAKEEIPVYPYDRVKRFLDSEVQKLNKKETQNPGLSYYDWSWKSAKKYTKEIPLSALQMMKRVKDKLPGAKFAISDYQVVRPDPFLAVWLGNSPFTVIHHWDEPDFELVDKKQKKQ
jgi:hypothetical protein